MVFIHKICRRNDKCKYALIINYIKKNNNNISTFTVSPTRDAIVSVQLHNILLCPRVKRNTIHIDSL